MRRRVARVVLQVVQTTAADCDLAVSEASEEEE